MSEQPKKKRKKYPPHTLKERTFVKKYIEYGGDSTKAALDVFNTTSRKSAQTMGSRMMSKIDIGYLLDERGLSDDKLVDLLKEGLTSANKIQGTNDDFIEIPDYAVRHKYLETAFKLKGYWGDRMKLAMEKDGDNVRILLDLPI